MAFILQNSLTPNTPVTEDFKRCVKHAIQQDPSHVAPSFDKMVHTLNMCRQQEELSRSKSAIVPGPSATASYEASTGDGLNPNVLDHSAYLAGVPEEQWPEAMHFYEVTTNRCFSCGKADHYIRDCPTRARGLLFNRKSRGPGALSFRPAQPRAPAPTLAPFYPFVGAMYPPPGIPYQPPVFPHQPPPFPTYQRPQYQQSQYAPPVPPQQPALRPADSWRPPQRPYQSSSQRSAPHSSRSTTSGGASARLADADADNIGDLLSGMDFHTMSAGLDDVSTSAIIDLGASHSLTGDLSLLHNFCKLKVPIPLNVATKGSGANISGAGELRFRTARGDTIALKEVLFCEQARSTLVSLAALRKANGIFHYDLSKDSFEIYDEHHRHLFSCVLERDKNRWCIPYPMIKSPSFSSFFVSPSSLNICCNLSTSSPDDPFVTPFERVYPSNWNPESMTAAEKQLLFWHRLFGHASLRRIHSLVKRQIGIGLPKELPAGHIHCPVCAISKSTSLNPVASSMRKPDKLDILCTDLMGPFPEATPDGALYLLTLRDAGTGYSYARLLKTKDEANKVLIEVITELETQTKKTVKVLRSDNGGEFANKILTNFLSGKGIIAERSLPYHHYQNGVIERFNRTIAEMGRTILSNSKLPQSFWGYAFQWANHVLNRILNKSSGEVTPFERMFGRPPRYDGFRVFGSKAYVHIPPEKRKKLDDWAYEAFVVGHCEASKGWVFYLPVEGMFVSSSMARFVNSLVPSNSMIKPPPFYNPVVKQRTLNSKDVLKHGKRVLTQVPVETERLVAPSSTFERKVLSDRPITKMSLGFIANHLELGNFRLEREFGNQELIINCVLESCTRRSMGFAKKTNADGTPNRYKARFVAKGFKQIAGLHFAETFAPTATFVSLRLLLVTAATHQWPVHSFDFVAAYLNSPINEEIWVKAPDGVSLPEGHAYRLKKALYGTRQAARCWWLHLRAILDDLGYSPSQYDTSLYVLRQKNTHGVIWVHVDDGVVTASSVELLQKLKQDLKDVLKIKWSHELESIVGLSIERNTSGFKLSQPKLINGLLQREWDGVLTAKTPLPQGFNATTEDGDPSTSTKFLSIIGTLSYLAVGTRPDISFAVNFLARFSAKPSVNHWKGLRHLINYIAGSTDLALCLYPKCDILTPLQIYCDASWGGKFSQSTYGVLINFMGCPVLWVSRRQATVAASTCHAEYMALGSATRHTLWVRHLLKDILGQDFVGLLLCDNQAAVKVSSDDASNKRTRHTDHDFFITNEALFKQLVQLKWIPTAEQLADIFTKSLGPELFRRIRPKLVH
ncbi:hypothetical protein PCASD_02641 [Puccinia coronata f. sp. avenae]|uniref:Uncharacterized protein n=1 Tax=Puccinia coronata f. sp. avenae TaxID=200324 RepID=A0A2N5VH29_9BASI|nr:hypothetical protein PCASD_02641 [Puccinia coronata f. sp. avenae]